METIIISVHIIVAISIVGLILLQQGKGAEMGASFGSGSSQTLFGPQGAGTVFSRATAILVAVFFVTSLSLAIMAKERVNGSLDEGIPNVEALAEPALMLDSGVMDSEIPEAAGNMQEQESDIPE